MATFEVEKSQPKKSTVPAEVLEALQSGFRGRLIAPGDMEDEGEDRIREAYGGNYDRLVAIKTKYDPTNLFRPNQNIKPNGA